MGSDSKQDFKDLLHWMRSGDEKEMKSEQQYAGLAEKVRNDRSLVEMTDRHGQTALIAGLVAGCPAMKVAMILTAQKVAARIQGPHGRLPLHFALDNQPREEVISLLLDAYPDSVRTPDADFRLPLHMLLEHEPFQQPFVAICLKMLDKFKAAARVPTQQRLPLHTCLEAGHPYNLISGVLAAHRAAAGVPMVSGLLPLHFAVVQNLDIRILTRLMEAYPAAMLQKIHYSHASTTGFSGADILPIEYVVQHRRATSVIDALLQGGRGRRPKSVAYARAAALGLVTKVPTHVRGHAVASISDVPSPETEMAKKGMLRGMGALSFIEREMLSVTVKPATGESIKVDMARKETLDELKNKIEQQDGTPRERQFLTFQGKFVSDHQVLGELVDKDTKELKFDLKARFDLLNQALKMSSDGEVVTQILALHPGAAKQEDRYGTLPLHNALLNHAAESVVLELLLEYPEALKVRLGSSSDALRLPLNIALEKKYSHKVIQEFLKGTNREDWSLEGYYNPLHEELDGQPGGLPLQTAITNGCTKETIQLLIDKSCPMSTRDRQTGMSALDAALAAGRGDELRDILHMDVQLFRDNRGSALRQHPLHIAVLHGASDSTVADLYNEHPKALHERDADGHLPIHLAVISGASFSVVRKLLSYDPRQALEADRQGRLPLHLAVIHRAPPGVVLEITRCAPDALGSGPEDGPWHLRRTHDGRSMLDLAAAANAPDWVVSELLDMMPVVPEVNLLNRTWPNTKAAAEIVRQVRLRQQQEATCRVGFSGGAHPALAGGRVGRTPTQSIGRPPSHSIRGPPTMSSASTPRGDVLVPALEDARGRPGEGRSPGRPFSDYGMDMVERAPTDASSATHRSRASQQEDDTILGTMQNAATAVSKWFGWS